MKLGIEEVRFRPLGGNYFKNIAEFGFTAAEYSFYDLEDEIYTLSEEERKEKLHRVLEMAKEAGVEIYQAHGPSHFQIDDKTAQGREKRMEATKTAIRACSYLGCKNLTLHTFMAEGEKDAEKAAEVFELNKELFGQLADYAKTFEVTLCIENMRQEKLSLGNPEEVIRLIDEVGRDNLKMCFDVGHAAIFSGKISIGDAVRRAGDRIACTHFHDNYGWVDVHLMPMTGVIDWDEVCSAFGDIGFDGVMSLDCSANPKLPKELFDTHTKLFFKVAKLLEEKIKA